MPQDGVSEIASGGLVTATVAACTVYTEAFGGCIYRYTPIHITNPAKQTDSETIQSRKEI